MSLNDSFQFTQPIWKCFYNACTNTNTETSKLQKIFIFILSTFVNDNFQFCQKKIIF